MLHPPIDITKYTREKSHSLDCAPKAPALKAFSRQYNLPDVIKFSFRGSLRAIGAEDWQLSGILGCSVKQTCVVSLLPITTRIEESVRRIFIQNFTPDSQEILEMPENTDEEALQNPIDLNFIFAEAITLALPDFPRHAKAVLDYETQQAKTPSDDSHRPFRNLGAHFTAKPRA